MGSHVRTTPSLDMNNDPALSRARWAIPWLIQLCCAVVLLWVVALVNAAEAGITGRPTVKTAAESSAEATPDV